MNADTFKWPKRTFARTHTSNAGKTETAQEGQPLGREKLSRNKIFKRYIMCRQSKQAERALSLASG